MSPKVRAQFMLTPELAAGLKALKARDGTSEGESVRRALVKYLKAKHVLRPKKKE